jgi:hypothetical protein
MGRARQQQVGDVRAGDEQHECDSTHQRPEDGAKLRADDAFVERRDNGRNVLVGVLVLALQLRGDVRELAARLLQAHAVGRASVAHQEPRRAALLPERGGELGHRHPHFRRERPLHAFRHHADDGDRQRVDADGFSDDAAIAGVAALPDAVADHHDRRRAGLIVFRTKASSERGLLPDDVEPVRGDVDARILLGDGIVRAEVHAAVEDDRHSGECPARPLPVLEILQRHAEVAPPGVARVEHHDAVGIVERKPPEEDRIDNREHRAVGADAERERGDGGEREPPVLDQAARGEAQILQEALHVRPPFPQAA